MNEAMTALLAARLNLSAEELELLQAGNAPALVARRVRDPVLAAALTSVLQPPPADESPAEPAAEEMLEQAREENRRLRGLLAAAQAERRYLADVFGACPYCLGRDESCTRCAGRGGPGTRVPLEEELLSAWVLPALRPLHMRVVRSSS